MIKLLKSTSRKHKIFLLAGIIDVVIVIVVCAFYFSSECSVRYGNLPIIDGGTSLKDRSCTCIGIEYQQRNNPEILGKSSTSMCAGVVLNRYEE